MFKQWPILGAVVLLLVLAACDSSVEQLEDITSTQTSPLQTTVTSQPTAPVPTTSSAPATTAPATTDAVTTTSSDSSTTLPVATIEDGVISTVVSHETTRDISVWAPEAEGSWPIVYALHGGESDRTRWDVAGRLLASQGLVVFAADYRAAEQMHWEQDGECGYRYALSIADDYGGDLDQPITMVGHSLGAGLVLFGGLAETTHGPEGTYDRCFTGTPRPDVIVAISGCHYEFQGQKTDFDSGWPGRANLEAHIVLVSGTDDGICETWQSEDATEALQTAGYDAKFVQIADANHFTVMFYDRVNCDEAGCDVVTLPDEPAGNEVVQTILDAIAAAQ